jgi:hypothetical protein
MNRTLARTILGAVLITGGLAAHAWSDDLKVVQTRKAKDVQIRILSDSGDWKQGDNTFVLEFTAAATKQPIDAGKVSLSTSMAMPGMAPMLAGATLTPDKAPGRYLGKISFPDSGSRQVTVTWDGPAGKGSAKFSIPVR